MAQSKDTPLAAPFALIGFLGGAAFIWNSTQNWVAALIGGAILGGLAGSIGNFVWRLLIVVAVVVVNLAMCQVRQEVVSAVLSPQPTDGAQQSTDGAQQPTATAAPGWQFCNNRGKGKIWLAVSHKLPNNWQNEGWFAIAPNQCFNFRGSTPAQHPSIFYYAYSETEDYVWSGTVPSCVRWPDAFAIRDADCATDQQVQFRRWDSNGQTAPVLDLN